MKQVKIYTDGACRGNPGPGGWGAVLEYGTHRRELKGSTKDTTNNRMELQAAIEALSCLKNPCTVEIVTDSKYLKDGIQVWILDWKRKGWKTANKKPVKNQDLWRQLDDLMGRHKVAWQWVRGHTGNVGNERADQLANEAIDQLLSL